MIEVTVALPMLRAKHIGWLALESLCRQENLRDRVEWELLIAEETSPEHEPFGKENLFFYEDRLKKVNCQRVEYLGLNEWIPLSRKWMLLAERASDTSKIFLLQAADCYSQPYRIYETYQLCEEGADWVQSPKGIFYNIPDEKVILFNYEIIKYPPHPCALNMAVSMLLAKKLPNDDVIRSVDKWMFGKCAEIKGGALSVGWNRKDTWRLGIDTNGVNNISARLNNFISPKAPFEMYDGKVSDSLPLEVLQRLRECKSFCPGTPNTYVISQMGTYGNARNKFDALQPGSRIKIKGKPSENDTFAAVMIDLDTSMNASEDKAVIDGLIQDINYQKHTLRLLNREFALPDGIEIKDLQRHIIGFKELKIGDRVKLTGKYSKVEGFMPKKVSIKEKIGSNLEKLEGIINEIDQKKKIFDVIGFTVRVN